MSDPNYQNVIGEEIDVGQTIVHTTIVLHILWTGL